MSVEQWWQDPEAASALRGGAPGRDRDGATPDARVAAAAGGVAASVVAAACGQQAPARTALAKPGRARCDNRPNGTSGQAPRRRLQPRQRRRPQRPRRRLSALAAAALGPLRRARPLRPELVAGTPPHQHRERNHSTSTTTRGCCTPPPIPTSWPTCSSSTFAELKARRRYRREVGAERRRLGLDLPHSERFQVEQWRPGHRDGLRVVLEAAA